MSDRADVVVVGGGVIGSSVAMHLQQAGAGTVRLIERDNLSQGTSAAGAGFVGLWSQIRGGHHAPELAAERYAVRLYAELSEQGYEIDYFHNGMLWIAPDDEAWQQLEGLENETWGSETYAVDPQRIAELTDGFVEADSVAGGVFHEPGIQISAGKAGPALADLFAKAGGVVDRRRPATGLRVAGGRVTGVETATGAIECDAVVVATGAWGNELLGPHGAFLPMVPLITSRIVTEPLGIPSTMPTLFLRGLSRTAFSSLWVRGHYGSLLWGGHYEAAPRSAFVGGKLPERFDQLPLDGVFECQQLGESAARFMPAFKQYESMTIAHGAPTWTPDFRGLAGPVPGIEGLWAIGGDNEAGVSHAPGYGKAVADHVVSGSSDLTSLDEWAIDRFGDDYPDEHAVAASVAERFAARKPSDDAD